MEQQPRVDMLQFMNEHKFVAPPSLVVFVGTPCTGKTTQARELLNLVDMDHFDVDAIRWSNQNGDIQIQDGNLSSDAEATAILSAYQTLGELAEKSIDNRRPVIVNGTFSKPEFKAILYQLLGYAKAKKIPSVVLEFSTVDEQAWKSHIEERTASGDSASNITTIEQAKTAKDLFYTPFPEFIRRVPTETSVDVQTTTKEILTYMLRRSLLIPKSKSVEDVLFLKSQDVQESTWQGRTTAIDWFYAAIDLGEKIIRVVDDEKRNASLVSEIHLTEGDAVFCFVGPVIYELGQLTNMYPVVDEGGNLKKEEWRGEGIENPKEITMNHGDYMFIPPGVGHRHKNAEEEKTGILFLIKDKGRVTEFKAT